MSSIQTIDGVVIRATPAKARPLIATTQLLQAHQSVAQPRRGQPDFFDMLKQAYPWFAKKNQEEAQPYLEGARIAQQYGLRQQVLLYANMVLMIVTRDRAESTLQLIEHRIGYKGQLYYRPDHESMPVQPFTVPLRPTQTTYTSVRYEWVYYPIATYSTLIPPRALQALTLVEEHGVPAQAYWVADKVKLRPTQRLLIDPVLCAQYGRWFVSVFDWI